MRLVALMRVLSKSGQAALVCNAIEGIARASVSAGCPRIFPIGGTVITREFPFYPN